MKEIYLDNGATTKVDTKVMEAMLPYFTEKYGNASSSHSFGQDAKDAIEKARRVIAKSISANDDEIYFTSGGTESNNNALKGVAFAFKSEPKSEKTNRNHIITTKIEHKCILETCKWLETQGFTVTYLDVDKEGFVNPDDIKKAITPKTILVSVIHGNNEIGTLQGLTAIGKVCREKGVYFHTDACQSYTKTEIDVNKQNLDLVTLNAHKIHGPKGIGALYVRKGTKIIPWQHGGGHERGLRSGTENVTGIVGFAEAVKLAGKKHIEHMAKLRNKLIDGVLKNIEDVRINGPSENNYKNHYGEDKRLCNNANFSFKAIEGEALGGYLDQKWICSSTGSACNARTLEPSYVLKAIGLTDEEANGSLRLTLSRFTTEEEIDYVLKVLPGIVKKLRWISPIGKVVNYILKKQ
ncbi:cysteine desulfurase [Candidatus Woesearchaeota archaeon]|nr:cysteine desulfurase [Candidatus Woesearchaeota archaeon]